MTFVLLVFWFPKERILTFLYKKKESSRSCVTDAAITKIEELHERVKEKLKGLRPKRARGGRTTGTERGGEASEASPGVPKS